MNSRQRRKARRIFRPLLKKYSKLALRDRGKTPLMEFLDYNNVIPPAKPEIRYVRLFRGDMFNPSGTTVTP